MSDARLNSAVGRRVHIHRKTLGWSLEKFALKCGISDTAIRFIEAGKKGPRLLTIMLIAKSLGCTLSDLVPDDWEDETPLPRDDV